MQSFDELHAGEHTFCPIVPPSKIELFDVCFPYLIFEKKVVGQENTLRVAINSLAQSDPDHVLR